MILLHIGTDKTGSTAIQKMLHWNCQALNDFGWEYPKSGMMHYDHARLKLALDDENIETFKQLKEEIDDSACENVILSHEGFYTLSEDKIRFFADFLRNLDKGEVRIVLYLRRQDEMIESGILQQIKTHENIPLLDSTANMPYLGHLDYSHVLSRWQENFGAESVMVRPYGSQFFENSESIYSGFATECLNLSVNEYKSLKIPTRDPNPSIDAISAHVISFLNQLGLDKKFFDSVADILLGLQQESPNKLKLFSAVQKEELLKRYSDGNKKIANLLPEDFFSLPVSVKESKVVSDKDVQKRLSDLYLKKGLIIGCVEWFGEPGFVNRVNENKVVLLDGWYELESWGAWARPENTARLAFRVARTIANGNGVVLSFDVMQLPGSNTKSFVRVEGNNEWIKLDSETPLELTKLNLQSRSGLIILEIKNDDVSSPQELGQGKDSRKLGCGIKSVGYTDAEI